MNFIFVIKENIGWYNIYLFMKIGICLENVYDKW